MSERRPFALEVLRIMLPVVILVLAGGGYYVLASRKQPPKLEDPKNNSPLVETVTVQDHAEGLDIEVDGLVVPYREITLSAEVDGRVTRKAEDCRSGNYVEQGDLLLEIDSQDYEIEKRRLEEELEQAVNSIKELEVEIANTEALVKLAEEELEIQHEESERLAQLFKDNIVTESDIDQTRRAELIAKTAVLSLRNQLHLKNTSRARLKSVEDRVAVLMDKVELDLSRTKITAPVSGMVVADSVEKDSYVRKGTELITIEDTSAVEVKCSLRVEELAWVWESVPRKVGPKEQADMSLDYEIPETPVTVVYRLGGRDYEWSGSLRRYDGIGLDETTRTVPCRIVVDDPTGGRQNGLASENDQGRPPALVRGMFVTVRIHVGGQSGLLSVPERAVRPGGRIWLVEDGKMNLLPVSIAGILDSRVLIRAGDQHPRVGDKVIVSPLPFAASGMAVRESPEL